MISIFEMNMRTKSELTGVKEIARLANVSVGTIDRVLHNRTGVSEETRQKVNAIIAELDYRPNKMASLLARRDSVKLSVIIPRSSEDTNYWSYPLAGIKQAIAEIKQFGVSADYYSYDLDSKAEFLAATAQVLNDGTNGVLLAPSFVEESSAFVKKLTELRIPYVFINSDLPKEESLSYIGPDLYQSGRLAAQLVKLMMNEDDDIVVVNISTQLELDHHLFRKEQGFRKYFEENNLMNMILTLNINLSNVEVVENQIHKAMQAMPRAKVIFVTNSRVHIVAKIIEKLKADVLLIGYDLIEKNIVQLEKGVIDLIINQRPGEQGYMGIMALYKFIFNAGEVEKVNYMSIDIITKENYKSYKN
jgi:LacI family transcriptional regulator